MTRLYNTESPLNRIERQNQNRTWEDILRRFSVMQTQINFIAGTDVEELIQRIEDTLLQVQTDTQNAIDTNNAAVSNALNDVSNALLQIQAKINEANTTITDTNAAKDSALQAIADLQDLIDSYSHRGEYSVYAQYYTNNAVVFDGSTYRAKRDNLNAPPPSTLGESNDDWQLVARRGTDAATENIRIWRGATPPSDLTTILWFEDPDMVSGQEIVIYGGVAAPTDSLALWLQEGGD